MYTSIRPGKVWYDTEGKRIQAHGGSILYAGGTFYWYGILRGESNPSKCGAKEHRPRRLDGAEH